MLLVGCSFTQGYSVADEETYAWRLNRRFPALAVDNFGTGGYSTHQAYLRMKAELDRRRDRPPALVVLGFFGHQMIRTVATPEWIASITDRQGNLAIPPHVVMDAQGRLQDRPKDRIVPWPLEDRSAFVAVLHKAAIAARFGREPAYAMKATLATVERMAALARERGVRFVTALLDGRQAPGGDETYTAFVAALEKTGVPYVSCIDPEYQRDPASRSVGGVGHPDGRTHAHWAACVGDWMARTLPDAAASDRGTAP